MFLLFFGIFNLACLLLCTFGVIQQLYPLLCMLLYPLLCMLLYPLLCMLLSSLLCMLLYPLLCMLLYPLFYFYFIHIFIIVTGNTFHIYINFKFC